MVSVHQPDKLQEFLDFLGYQVFFKFRNLSEKVSA